MAYRYLFGWAGGLTIAAARLSVFPGADAGLSQRAAQSARGYHRLRARRRGADGHRDPGLGARHASRDPAACRRSPIAAADDRRDNCANCGRRCSNRAFVVLMLAGVCAYTNQGISYALSNYLYAMSGGSGRRRSQLLPWRCLLGAAVAFVIAPRIGKRDEQAARGDARSCRRARSSTLPYWLRFCRCAAAGRSRVLPCCSRSFAMPTALQRVGVHPGRVDDGRCGRGFGGAHRAALRRRVLRRLVLRPEMHVGARHLRSPARSSRSPGFPDKAAPGTVSLASARPARR